MRLLFLKQTVNNEDDFIGYVIQMKL